MGTLDLDNHHQHKVVIKIFLFNYISSSCKCRIVYGMCQKL